MIERNWRAGGAAIALTTLLSLLAGCGAPAPTAHRAVTRAKPAPKNNFEAPQSAKDQQMVRSILQAVDAANQSLVGYTGTIDTVDQKDGHKAFGKATFKFLKPAMTRLDLISNSDHADQAGTRVFWDGSSNVQVRAGGLFGALKLTLAMNDQRLQSLNGYTINQLHHIAILKALFDPQAVIKPMGPQMVGSRQAMMLAVSGVSPAPGVDHMMVGIDYTSRLPISFAFYTGETLTYSLQMAQFSTTPPKQGDLTL
jgi:hypothetical protein